MIVIGGDLCGKGLVPLVRGGNERQSAAPQGDSRGSGSGSGRIHTASGGRHGEWIGTFAGKRVSASSDKGLAELERNIRFHGFYPLRCEPEELERLQADPAARERAFEQAMTDTVARWVEIAEEKLAARPVPCVVIPGNDDPYAIDEALSAGERVINCEQRVVSFKAAQGIQVVGFGATNRTPWNSPRELDEDQVEAQLGALLAQADPELPLIANVHAPPYGSQLDDAPRLDSELRQQHSGGTALSKPVGSHAVRRLIEEHQPIVSLHGHVHESRAARRIGDTLAVNPGSDYSAGILQAALVTLDLKQRRVRGHQFISG